MDKVRRSGVEDRPHCPKANDGQTAAEAAYRAAGVSHRPIFGQHGFKGTTTKADLYLYASVFQDRLSVGKQECR